MRKEIVVYFLVDDHRHLRSQLCKKRPNIIQMFIAANVSRKKDFRAEVGNFTCT